MFQKKERKDREVLLGLSRCVPSTIFNGYTAARLGDEVMVCWETFLARLRRLRVVPPESNERELREELGVDTHEEAERLVKGMSDAEIVRLAERLKKRKSRATGEMTAYA